MKNNLTALTSARYELLTSKTVGLSGGAFGALVATLDDAIGYPAPSALYANVSDIPTSPIPVGPLPAKKKSRKGFLIALCVGHSRRGDSGASSTSGVSEQSFYSRFIVKQLAGELMAMGFEVVIIDEYEGGSYGSAMRWLAGELKRLGVDLAYELHFNAATPSAHGFETLFWHKSKVSRKVAEAMQTTQAKAYPEMKDRDVEPLGDQAHERGTLFCSLPACPSLILEPFFGSSSREVREYMSAEPAKRDRFVSMLANGIGKGADLLLA